MADQVGAARRALRRATLGTGPLGRRSDHVELASRLLAAAVLVLALPVALTVGTVVGADASVRAQELASVLREEQAVLLTDAPGTATPGDELRVLVPATWPAADGTPREGLVAVPREARAGDPVDIWVDRGEHRTVPPPGTAHVVTSAVLAGVFTLLGLTVASAGGHLVVCRTLWHRRSRQWAQEWRSVEPLWSGRR